MDSLNGRRKTDVQLNWHDAMRFSLAILNNPESPDVNKAAAKRMLERMASIADATCELLPATVLLMQHWPRDYSVPEAQEPARLAVDKFKTLPVKP